MSTLQALTAMAKYIIFAITVHTFAPPVQLFRPWHAGCQRKEPTLSPKVGMQTGARGRWQDQTSRRKGKVSEEGLR